jgi:hypothetical protein
MRYQRLQLSYGHSWLALREFTSMINIPHIRAMIAWFDALRLRGLSAKREDERKFQTFYCAGNVLTSHRNSY